MKLFDRLCRVTIYRPDGKSFDNPGGFVSQNQGFFEVLNNGLEITALRMSFEIEKTITKDPNTCDVIIYNLAEKTRALVQKQPLTVRLDAGYDGVLRQMFLGNLHYSSSYLKGVDWETKLQLKDGGAAFAHARVNRSYKAGTPVRTILADAAQAMGLRLPRKLSEETALDARIPSSTSLDGLGRDELTRLLAPYGYTWSIQNQQLQILSDTAVRNDSEFLISQDTGLIGSPEYGSGDRDQKKPKLTFSTLLYPELQPGSRVRMDCRAVKGSHKLLRVKHAGDTHGDDWSTECEAKPL